MAREPRRKITVYHVSAPTCWWSWGYEGALNRIRQRYGNQVTVRTFYGTVWEDFGEYLKENDLTIQGLRAWAKEAAGTMGVPIRATYTENEPKDLKPATHASMAALGQGPRKGERFVRAVMRRFVVEGLDVTDETVLTDAATEAGLDLAKFRKASHDPKGLAKAIEHQGHSWPHLPIGFYNVAISDGRDRTVILDDAFDPSVLEEAIDYLSNGSLRKHAPPDVVTYLRTHGLSPAMELARITGVKLAPMERRLAALEKKGRVEQVRLAGAAHWRISSR
ncbi:MAG TPA: DsbA family protein [Thermoplasmata archaeon]|jgi:predicted DsbA family dithiol-disulfide isomerase|nr:DsbA family protein [Thermoplasmata archaeon]